MAACPPPDRVALAHERLAARARRIRLIRQRIVASMLAAFVLAWGVVAFDGSMGTTTTVASTTTATAATTSSSDDADSSSTSDEESASEDSTTASSALLASSLAVSLGLMMSTRMRTKLGDLRVPRRPSPTPA